jgi:hypothetical protein
MKLLTINMGMDLDKHLERLELLGDLVTAKKPDFIALQNVSIDGVKLLKSLHWTNRYNISSPPTTFETRKKPQCVIMSTYPPNKDIKWFHYKDPDSSLYILWSYYILNDKQKQPHVLTIATTQLEVGVTSQCQEIREKQLNQALFFSQENEDVILMGDMSIIDAVDGHVSLSSPWKDAWLELPSSSPDTGHTFDPSNNTLIKVKTIPSFRPDRILYSSRRYKLDNVELVGMQVEPSIGIHLSNHYGLLATFTIMDNVNFLPVPEPAVVPCSFERPN